MEIHNKEEFIKEHLNIQLDKWQKRLLEADGKNIVIRSGRQVGKSFTVSLKTCIYALENGNKTILVVAASQRQSSLLFEKIISFFMEYFPDMIKDDPTKTRLFLTNDTKIYCVPAGRTGYAIRGFTIDLLIADEAAFISESVWVAVVPMLATTGGKMILLSTPWGKGGYFYNAFGDSDFVQFHINSEDCPRIPPEFLRKEKARMTKLQYAQEYLGEFVEEYTQLINTQLIKECSTLLRWNYKENYDRFRSYYLGVDVARYGGDENAFCIIEIDKDDKLRLVKVLTTSRISTMDTVGRIIDLDKMFNFRRVFVDDAGVGGGVLDALIEKLSRKVVGINNSTRAIDKEGKRKLKLMKEDLYSNLIVLMEQHKIELIDIPELKRSLQSIQFEYTGEGNLRIYGNYTHMAEALVRAAWCIRAKGLKVFIS
jgi:hypothetical protein